MARQKLLKEISTEELLNLLDDSKTTEDYTTNNDVANFLNFYSILPGTHKISDKFLYDLYKRWSNNPIPRVPFGREASKYIQITHTDTIYYFLINYNAFSLNKKVYDLLKKPFMQKIKSPPYKRHYDSFIKFYDVKKGNYWITADLLHYLYRLWTYKTKYKHPMGIKNFSDFCKLYFEFKEVGEKKELYFRIDDSITKYLTKERLQQYEEIKAYHQEKKKASYKKK